jgi:ADP-ribose pyrophosphatase YjhB (NUDIX family)
MNPGESPRAAAERELLEETGLRAGKLVDLPGFYPTNGISAHYAHAFVAEGCTIVGEPTPDDSEQLFRRLFTRDQVRRRVHGAMRRVLVPAVARIGWRRVLGLATIVEPLIQLARSSEWRFRSSQSGSRFSPRSPRAPCEKFARRRLESRLEVPSEEQPWLLG